MELEEGFNLSKSHRVDHCPHSAEFAKDYVKGMKGDHRSGGPTEADTKNSNKFWDRYDSKDTRSGFAGSGTTVYTHKGTGAKFEVDRTPDGRGFYGTHHNIQKLNEESMQEVEQMEEAIDNGPGKIKAPTVKYGQTRSTTGSPVSVADARERLGHIKAAKQANSMAGKLAARQSAHAEQHKTASHDLVTLHDYHRTFDNVPDQDPHDHIDSVAKKHRISFDAAVKGLSRHAKSDGHKDIYAAHDHVMGLYKEYQKEEVEMNTEVLDESIHAKIKSLLDAGHKVKSFAAGRAGMDIDSVDGNSVHLSKGTKKYSTTFASGDKVKIEKHPDHYRVVNEETDVLDESILGDKNDGAYKAGHHPVGRKIQGKSYGANYNPDEEEVKPAGEKRGRGRPKKDAINGGAATWKFPEGPSWMTPKAPSLTGTKRKVVREDIYSDDFNVIIEKVGYLWQYSIVLGEELLYQGSGISESAVESMAQRYLNLLEDSTEEQFDTLAEAKKIGQTK
jgi:hypothetical protein